MEAIIFCARLLLFFLFFIFFLCSVAFATTAQASQKIFFRTQIYIHVYAYVHTRFHNTYIVCITQNSLLLKSIRASLHIIVAIIIIMGIASDDRINDKREYELKNRHYITYTYRIYSINHTSFMRTFSIKSFFSLCSSRIEHNINLLD